MIGRIEGAIYVTIPKETVRIACIGTKYEQDLESHRILEEACYCPEEYKPEADLFHTFFEHMKKQEKGRYALEKIRSKHDPYKYQQELRKNLF